MCSHKNHLPMLRAYYVTNTVKYSMSACYIYLNFTQTYEEDFMSN
jgi:hypothetical protein